ncbi:hypothetical protein CCACVL1_01216, partial [Corchorus capsularis]
MELRPTMIHLLSAASIMTLSLSKK